MVLDFLVSENAIESDIVPFCYFEHMRLKRIGSSYSELINLAPKNWRRVVLGKMATKSALGQQIQPGALCFILGLTETALIEDESAIEPGLLGRYHDRNGPKKYLTVELTPRGTDGASSAILIMNPIHPAGQRFFQLSDSLIKAAVITQTG